MRAALYARYSSDKQSDRSIDDQLAVCRRHAEARGWAVVATFDDRAISGAAMANRPGLQALLAAAEEGAFDLVLVEHEDRLARNLEHLAHVASRLAFAEIRLATLSTDQVEDMHVAINGLQAAQYLKNLGAKTRRGMTSNAEQGLATGSRLYGYRTAPGGAVEIVEAEAKIIRQIFSLYVDEKLNARAIAHRLNSEGAKGPRGGQWNASTINGSTQRGNGILQTELYAGVKVFNRLEVRKDPRTGKRLSRIRPAADWRRTPVPQLAIVPADTFAAAAARKAEERHQPTGWQGRRVVGGPFSGLLKCGCCGGGYVIYGGDRLACATRREKGETACANRRTLSRTEVERRVLEGLQAQLLAPAAVQAYVRAYHAAWARQAAAQADRRAPAQRRLAELERGIERAVDAVVAGLASEAVKARLVAMEAEKRQLASELAAAPAEAAPPIALHPRAAEGYARTVAQLQARLGAARQASEDPLEQKIVDAVRDLVERIDLTPATQDRAAAVEITIHARALRAFGSSEAAPDQCRVGLVAGGGIVTTPIWSPLASVALRLPPAGLASDRL